MSNSSLSCKRLISPNRNSPRNHKIDTITIHCVVGQMGVDALCSEFSRESKGASCNYGLGYDGRICTVVWRSTDAFVGIDLEPVDQNEPSATRPSRSDLYFPNNLEVVE